MDGANLVKSLNKNGKNVQVDIQVITLSDNLTHPYFSSIDISKNNYSPVGIAKMEAPYTPHISNYWIKYSGVVVVSFNMMDLQQKNTNSLNFLESNKLKQRIVNDEYNYSFICKVSRFKQQGRKLVIYFEDIGWKFMQKVPKEFRDQYISGQYLDDAFQAICEFLGVEFAYSIEDLHAFTFSTDGYSVQKEGGETIEDVPSILKEWGPDAKEEEGDELDDPMNENPGLIDFDQKNKNQQDKLKNNINNAMNDTKNIINSAADSLSNLNPLNALENNESNENSENEEDKQNVDEKIAKYQEEFDQKILDLFIGNTYYESDLTSQLMNYSRITIVPKAMENNNDVSPSSVDGGATNENNEEEGSDSSGSSSSGSSNSGTIGAKGVWGKTAKGSLYLTKDAINKMSREEASRRYQDGKKRNIYTAATMSKLFQRSFGIWLI